MRFQLQILTDFQLPIQYRTIQ